MSSLGLLTRFSLQFLVEQLTRDHVLNNEDKNTTFVLEMISVDAKKIPDNKSSQ